MFTRDFWPKSLPINQDRTEVRMLALLVNFFYYLNVMETTTLAASVESSAIHLVVAMSGNSMGVVVIFLVAAAMMLPHLLSLVFMPRWLSCRSPRQLACAGASFTALTWFYLSYLAWHLPLETVSLLYAFRASVHLAFAAVLAFSLNSQQIRPRFDHQTSQVH